MKKLVIGILAHVDAGKTTLSESMLYLSGKIRKPGRVDKKDAYLDTYALEKERGITIFAKQAVFAVGDTQITLLDTPGHVDFSAEMERTLQVLDYAILVISGADGVQAHTGTLWRLLEIYRIPTFIFVNKMDQTGTDKAKIMKGITGRLGDGCVEFVQTPTDAFYDRLAMCDEKMMESYLKTGRVGDELIREAVTRRRLFPCFFGSALRLEGVEHFMHSVERYTLAPHYPEEFGAKIFKISRDEQGSRLTHLKITGGRLQVRDILTYGAAPNPVLKEKVNQIRVYSGQKYEAVGELEAGSVCAVTGLSQTKPGEGLGIEQPSAAPVLEPVLTYRVLLPEGLDPRAILPKLRQLEEEQPELQFVWDERLGEIQVQLMGEVQLEILRSLIDSRFGVGVDFGDGKIVYKETVASAVEGVGHFEPLRHYAEVHLLLEPGERGSGLRFAADCSEDVLGRSWQRLVLTHLQEKVHKGVLTGSAITDMKITLVSGRAHIKHTEGGDFREATYRAVRQGLKEAESVLLEPFYAFELELPEKMVGKAMTDIEKMDGKCEIVGKDGGAVTLTGSAPVAAMRNYHKEVAAYTKGLGRLICSLKGYEPCHNAQEVIEQIGYDSECDTINPTGSVFCTHGAGFTVYWFEVKNYMHVESYFKEKSDQSDDAPRAARPHTQERWISLEEIDRIFSSTFYANQGKKSDWKKGRPPREAADKPAVYVGTQREEKQKYLLVDGYNILFAWPELKALADDNMDGARMKLIDLLSGYRQVHPCRIIVVFDAYRVQQHREETVDFQDIHMVFTREAQTADQYIERFAHENQQKYAITVATSDGLQQIIVRGAGCTLLSARELRLELENAAEKVRLAVGQKQGSERRYLADALSPEVRQRVEKLTKKPDGQ